MPVRFWVDVPPRALWQRLILPFIHLAIFIPLFLETKHRVPLFICLMQVTVFITAIEYRCRWEFTDQNLSVKIDGREHVTPYRNITRIGRFWWGRYFIADTTDYSGPKITFRARDISPEIFAELHRQAEKHGFTINKAIRAKARTAVAKQLA